MGWFLQRETFLQPLWGLVGWVPEGEHGWKAMATKYMFLCLISMLEMRGCLFHFSQPMTAQVTLITTGKARVNTDEHIRNCPWLFHGSSYLQSTVGATQHITLGQKLDGPNSAFNCIPAPQTSLHPFRLGWTWPKILYGCFAVFKIVGQTHMESTKTLDQTAGFVWLFLRAHFHTVLPPCRRDHDKRGKLLGLLTQASRLPSKLIPLISFCTISVSLLDSWKEQTLKAFSSILVRAINSWNGLLYSGSLSALSIWLESCHQKKQQRSALE